MRTTLSPIKTILLALAGRHAHDIFVPACKDGPSGRGVVQMDAWAMKKSWAHSTVSGYEIKMSRSDFMGDKKWHGYLPLCNQLWFVCPYGLLQPEEMPGEVGLLWASRKGTRVYQKRKAAYREVQIPEGLFRYILMWRAVIGDEHMEKGSNKAFWQSWLRNKEYNKRLGGMVSKRIREYVWKVERENKDLKEMMVAYEEVRAWLTRAGINVDDEWDVRRAERRLEELKKVIPTEMRYTFNSAYRDLRKIVSFIRAEGLNK